MRAKTAVVVLLLIGFGYLLGQIGPDLDRAHAAGGEIKGPNVVVPDRYIYYPGTIQTSINTV